MTRAGAAPLATLAFPTRYVEEAPPCRAAPETTGPPLGRPPSSTTCRSRRRFTVRLPRRLRSARVYVAGKRVVGVRT